MLTGPVKFQIDLLTNYFFIVNKMIKQNGAN